MEPDQLDLIRDLLRQIAVWQVRAVAIALLLGLAWRCA